MDLTDRRNEYAGEPLDKASAATDPLVQFHRWMDEALAAQVNEPTAMTLATIDAGGRPAARVVLLKEATPAGFCFYTNYESDKAQQLEAHPHAALTFFWPELSRQVRVRGPVVRTSADESRRYFATRPRGSQLGALASDQSRVIAGRAVLDEKLASLEREYADRDVPMPAHWGGYRVQPVEYEFWQGRENRLHDRLRYRRGDDDRWVIERLAP